MRAQMRGERQEIVSRCLRGAELGGTRYRQRRLRDDDGQHGKGIACVTRRNQMAKEKARRRNTGEDAHGAKVQAIRLKTCRRWCSAVLSWVIDWAAFARAKELRARASKMLSSHRAHTFVPPHLLSAKLDPRHCLPYRPSWRLKTSLSSSPRML